MDGFKRFYVGSPIRTDEITVRGVGYRERMRPVTIDRPSGTGDWLFMAFYDPVLLWRAGRPERFAGKTGVAWAPGDRQYYGNPDRGFAHTWMHGDGRRIRDAIRAVGLPVGTPFPLRSLDGIEACALALHREMETGERADAVVAGNVAENLVREFWRAGGFDGQPVAPERIAAVRRHIETHYREPLSLRELARQAGCSVPHFCAEFKRVYGFSALDYAIRLRMAEAVHCLRDVNMPVAEVAMRVGYEDVCHFSKLFKRHVGVAPSATRAPKKKRKKEKHPLA